MADMYALKSETLQGIADAIKLKSGDDTPMSVDDMALRIGLIEGGGSCEIKEGVLDVTHVVNSGTFTFEHGCAGAPQIVMIISNADEVFNADTVPSNSTLMTSLYNAVVGVVVTRIISTTLSTTNLTASLPTTNQGYITDVTDEVIVYSASSARRLDPLVTYRYIAIRFI